MYDDSPTKPPVTTDQIAAALRKSEERFRQVVESAPNAMVMINGAGTIEMVNAQAERVFGYDREELLGQPIEMLVPQRFRGNHPSLRGSFFTDPKSRPMGAGRDLYGLKKDGSEFPIEIGLEPDRDRRRARWCCRPLSTSPRASGWRSASARSWNRRPTRW